MFGKRCGELNVSMLMGTVGDAYDNAMAESFFATLERELLDRGPSGQSREPAGRSRNGSESKESPSVRAARNH